MSDLWKTDRLGITWISVAAALLFGGALSWLLLLLLEKADASLPEPLAWAIIILVALVPTLFLILYFVRNVAGVEMRAMTLFVVPPSLILAYLLLIFLSIALSIIGISEGRFLDAGFLLFWFLCGSFITARGILLRDLWTEGVPSQESAK